MNAFELTPQEAEERYRGAMFTEAAPVADDVLVTFQHQPIGLAETDWFAIEKQLSA